MEEKFALKLESWEKKKMLRKVISGGQTGADQGALEGARLAGVATGGLAARGWATENGPQEELLSSYGLTECLFPGYPARTRANILTSDGTLVIYGEPLTGGSKLTVGYCLETGKTHYTAEWFHSWGSEMILAEILNFLYVNEIRVLNVAGNRESKNPGIQEATRRLVLQLCGAVNG
jgi:hypothetical protein